MKTNFISVLFLSAAVAACSGTGTSSTGNGGEGGEGGEQPVTSNNSTSSSSGMGGAGGAGGAGGTGGSGGAMMPPPKADKLGQICNGMMACPAEYVCILLDAMATNGFCTIPCNGTMDMVTCSADNGFPGPGAGQCVLGAQDAMGNVTNVCGVLCGAQFSLPDTCPTGLTCQDKINAMGMQGTDGKNDICAP